MAGAGTVGTGGLGVGGWQIYEEVNPSNHRSLSRQGYSYSPIISQKLEKPDNSRFDLNKWGCVERLFPQVEIKNNSVEETLEKSDVQLPTIANPDNFTACAIMEMKPMTVSDKPNRIFSKTEVAVKGDNWGLITWTFISTLPELASGSSTYKDDFNFLYRVLFLKKNGDNWEVENGLAWNHYSPTTPTTEKFIIAPPIDREGWFTPDNVREYKDASPFQAKSWAGIGEIDRDSESKEKDLLQSISIYTNGTQNAEFWGNTGEFKGDSQEGYASIQRFYIKGQGWKSMKDATKSEDFSSQLKTWYAPFKSKKIKWSNMGDRCNSWSRTRNKGASLNEESLLNLCYRR